jgi:hypothetical protein
MHRAAVSSSTSSSSCNRLTQQVKARAAGKLRVAAAAAVAVLLGLQSSLLAAAAVMPADQAAVELRYADTCAGHYSQANAHVHLCLCCGYSGYRCIHGVGSNCRGRLLLQSAQLCALLAESSCALWSPVQCNAYRGFRID